MVVKRRTKEVSRTTTNSHVVRVRTKETEETVHEDETEKTKSLAADEATAVNKKDIQKDIELAISKRAKYLHQQISHLKPFMEEKAVQALEERAEKFEPSDKLLMPVENQPACYHRGVEERIPAGRFEVGGTNVRSRMFVHSWPT